MIRLGVVGGNPVATFPVGGDNLTPSGPTPPVFVGGLAHLDGLGFLLGLSSTPGLFDDGSVKR